MDYSHFKINKNAALFTPLACEALHYNCDFYMPRSKDYFKLTVKDWILLVECYGDKFHISRSRWTGESTEADVLVDINDPDSVDIVLDYIRSTCA